MNVWGWILLYVVVFSVLQLLIYRYLRSDDDAPLLRSAPRGAEQTPGEDVRKERVLEEHSTSDADPDTHRCPHCGTKNDAQYTYCRNCVEPLGVW